MLVPILIVGFSKNHDEKFNPNNVITAVIKSIQLHYQLVTAKFIRLQIIRQNDLSFAKQFEELCRKIENLESALKNHIQLQLGFETVYQLMGTNILLFYAYSNTKTRQGLTALFEHEPFSILGIDLSPSHVVALLLALNLLSFVKAQVSGIVDGYVSNYSFFGKGLIILAVLCSCIVGIMSKTLFFAPILGLFNLLHHYQGT